MGSSSSDDDVGYEPEGQDLVGRNEGQEQNHMGDDEGEHQSVGMTDLGDLGNDTVDGNNSSDDNYNLANLSDCEKMNVYPEFVEERDMKNPKLQVGMIFSNVVVFRTFLREFHIKEGCGFKFIKNASSKVTVVCKDGCGFRLHASPLHDTRSFRIKSLKGPHSWGRKYYNSIATSSWITNKYVEKLNDTPEWKVKSVKDDVRKGWMLYISSRQVYRAKRKAIEVIQGKHEDQYLRHWDYCEMVRIPNLGSITLLKVERPWLGSVPIFQRMFIMYDAQARGFIAHCRPIIGLDACFLKGPYGGQLMHAIGRDANNQMYHLAIAVVEAETKNSWSWFLKNLISVLGRPEERGWIIMSDRQKVYHIDFDIL